VQCQNESGMVPINNQEVTQDDVDNVIHAARSVPMAAERKLLHVLPQEFVIDVQEGIKNPIGMSGVRMVAAAHIITCADDMAKNMVKCIEKCELTVDQTIFSALASSYAILTEDEKELGVCVADIGGGTIDIVIYTGGALRHTAVIPLGGNQRYHELLEIAYEQIKASGLEEQIAAGLVITGGTAKMEGAVEFAEEVFKMPVRVGKPHSVKGLAEYVDDPSYATAVGLLQYGKENSNNKKILSKGSDEGVLKRIQSWFKGEF